MTDREAAVFETHNRRTGYGKFPFAGWRSDRGGVDLYRFQFAIC